ncbi:MAG: hypothetical protein NTW97_01450 [Candidatus Krumholzibacteria bacterium]|nr:hypothetical protein [Candidatus Krumholzibacteria bacterium]
MKRNRKKLDELESRLFSAYRSGESRTLGAESRESVMREIRRMGAGEAPNGVQLQIGRFAWRFSAAACVVALLLLVYVFSNGFVDYQELALRYLENPMDFII